MSVIVGTLKDIGWNEPIPLPQFLLCIKYYTIYYILATERHQHSENLIPEWAIAILIFLFLILHTLLHSIINKFREFHVNIWRSSLRSCVALTLCISVLLEISHDYVNLDVVPFSLNIFWLMFSIILCVAPFPSDAARFTWLSFFQGIWNWVSLAFVMWNSMVIADNVKVYNVDNRHTLWRDYPLAYWIFVVDFLATPISSFESSRAAKDEDPSRNLAFASAQSIYVFFIKSPGFIWRALCAIFLTAILIHRQINDNFGCCSLHMKMFFDKTTSSELLSSNWFYLIFIIPNILYTIQFIFQKWIFKLFSNTMSHNLEKQKMDERHKLYYTMLTKNLLMYTLICIVAFGLNAAFYVPFQQFLLVLHFVLHWISHISGFISMFWERRSQALPAQPKLNLFSGKTLSKA